MLIFCENKTDVDDIHEYLMLKGVEAVAIHGGKDQAEREYAIQMFKQGRKDVLIGTDVASKGLDFPEIRMRFRARLREAAGDHGFSDACARLCVIARDGRARDQLRHAKGD